MDRRRFVPSHEGLEVRTLQATNLTSVFGSQINSNLNLPITFEQKAQRIERLPYFLGQITNKDRFLPKAEIEQIQSALFGMVGKIERPPSQSLDNYNYQLRRVIAHESISTADIQRLNYSFGAVLTAAKAPTSSITKMQKALFNLVSQVDTASALPVVLATNDYSLTLQTALAIGRPMPAPIVPKIKKDQGVQANVNHIKTTFVRPHLVGTYHFHTVVQVVTPAGIVVGVAPVNKNNNYTVHITVPQTIGVHEFRVQAVDSVGNVSNQSKPFLIKVLPKK